MAFNIAQMNIFRVQLFINTGLEIICGIYGMFKHFKYGNNTIQIQMTWILVGLLIVIKESRVVCFSKKSKIFYIAYGKS